MENNDPTIKETARRISRLLFEHEPDLMQQDAPLVCAAFVHLILGIVSMTAADPAQVLTDYAAYLVTNIGPAMESAESVLAAKAAQTAPGPKGVQ